jgi:dTDP-glucose 4,6-dehydratase
VTHVLVTGGAGFIGSHIVDLLLSREDARVTVLDRLSRGGSAANLEHLAGDMRFAFVHGDVCDAGMVTRLASDVDAVVHAAAESHVDRGIDSPAEFLDSNVVGTQRILEAVRKTGARMLMVSTDEVYGPGDPNGGVFDEDDALRPRSPYAATKAAADLLCRAYHETFGTAVTVVRGSNAFGPRQIEKVIPTYAVNALEGHPIPVYGNGEHRREFLHVSDWVVAAVLVLDRGEPGRVYNIGGGHELRNVDLARQICALVGVPESTISFVPDRPGHDFRYGVSADRVRSLGWRPTVPFEEGLAATVAWYRSNLGWLRAAHDGKIVTRPRAAQASP